MNVQVPISPDHEYASVQFTGANETFRNLVMRGALLELITFGFYRFWLVTDIRRHLWSNTEIDGDALEYTGRGKELMLGFLMAMAILAPVFIVYFLAGIALERQRAFASIPLYVLLYLFGQFAVFRARRYRLTRTIWRGVRFWMTGSGWAYAIRALAWMALTVLTLGFAYPFQMAALERYKFDRTRYGDLQAGFTGSGATLFKRVWWIWLIGLVPPLMIYGPLIHIAMKFAPGMKPPGMTGLTATMEVIGFLSAIALPFMHAMRKAVEWRWWVEGIRFGDVSIECTLPRGRLVNTYWKLIGNMVLVTIGEIVLATIAMVVIMGVAALTLRFGFGIAAPGALKAAFEGGAAGLGVGIGIGVNYLVLLLSYGVVVHIYTQQRVWKIVANACRMHNPIAVANVHAAGEPVNALGEGLIDGMDLAGF